jgi:hypothetical protein
MPEEYINRKLTERVNTIENQAILIDPVSGSINPAGVGAVAGVYSGVRGARYRSGQSLVVPTGVATAGRTWHLARRAPFPFDSVSIFCANHTGADITVASLGAAAAANLTDPKMLGASWVGDTTDLVIPANGVAIRKLDVRSVAPDDGIAGYPVSGRLYSAAGLPYKTFSDSATWASLYPAETLWMADAGGEYASANQGTMPNAAASASVNVTMAILPHYLKRTSVVLVCGDSLDAFEFLSAGGTYARFDSPVVSAVRARQAVGAQVEAVSCAKASDGYTTFSTRAKACIDLLLPDVVCIPNLTPNGLTGTGPADADGVWAVHRAAKDLAEYARSKGATVLWRTAWPNDLWTAGNARITAMLEINAATRASGEPYVDVASLAAGADGRYASEANKAQDGSNLHYSTTMRDAAALLYADAFKRLGI